MEEALKYTVAGVIGLITGVIGSLVAPWIHWGIEKRKQRLASRREFVSEARKAVAIGKDRRSFRESLMYSRLRPHLTERTRDLIESERMTIQNGGRGEGTNNYKHRVLDDIQALESKWKLL